MRIVSSAIAASVGSALIALAVVWTTHRERIEEGLAERSGAGQERLGEGRICAISSVR